MTDTRKNRIEEAAQRYAAADRTDPFALARARAHIKNGIADLDADGAPHYDADEVLETRRLPDGMKFLDGSDTYEVKAYRNIKRV